MHGMRKADRGIWHDRVRNKSLNVTSGTRGHKHFMLSAPVTERAGERIGGNSEAYAFHMKDLFFRTLGKKVGQGHLKSDFSRCDEMRVSWVLDCQAESRGSLMSYPFVEPSTTYGLGLLSGWPSATHRLEVQYLFFHWQCGLWSEKVKSKNNSICSSWWICCVVRGEVFLKQDLGFSRKSEVEEWARPIRNEKVHYSGV